MRVHPDELIRRRDVRVDRLERGVSNEPADRLRLRARHGRVRGRGVGGAGALRSDCQLLYRLFDVVQTRGRFEL